MKAVLIKDLEGEELQRDSDVLGARQRRHKVKIFDIQCFGGAIIIDTVAAASSTTNTVNLVHLGAIWVDIKGHCRVCANGV